MIDVTLGAFWDRGRRSLYKNVMFCTFFRLRNSQAKACGYLKEICNVGVNKEDHLDEALGRFQQAVQIGDSRPTARTLIYKTISSGDRI